MLVQNDTMPNRTISQLLSAVMLLVLLVSPGLVRADKQAVHALVDGFHAAAANSDFRDYFGRFTEDAYFLGTDASERWSVNEFKDYARQPFAEGRGWQYTVLERNVEAGAAADVFWFDEVLDNAALGRCRGTGVVVKENGRWKIAHYSLTLLIPNDVADEVGAISKKQDAAKAAR